MKMKAIATKKTRLELLYHCHRIYADCEKLSSYADTVKYCFIRFGCNKNQKSLARYMAKDVWRRTKALKKRQSNYLSPAVLWCNCDLMTHKDHKDLQACGYIPLFGLQSKMCFGFMG